ncbi:unnamed protein product [Spodoptera littoralis]|uniref:Farnesyl pyrophosphate synthase n=1 Tax=Spodoptera littoralis TaxID=7109 RepID=A0A9P0N3H9_SPOLI|nr:unnamed protein product [Spodoptera littoralis]CAH1640238.1 unnamed protein product [Spodoptera littoralis]
MAKLVRYNRLCYNQLRPLHSNNLSVPIINLETEKKAFQDILPEFIDNVITRPKIKQLPQVATWMKQLLEYTLTGGKLGRGLMASTGYKMFEDPDQFSEKTQHSARLLGWCVEMLHTSLIVFDDVLDGGTVRHGKPSWHLRRSVGNHAFTDSMLIHHAMMDIIEMYFGKTPFYNTMSSYFHEASYRTTIAEHMDLCSSYNKDTDNIDIFTMNHLHDIAVYKSAYYSFKLPIFAALLLVKNGQNLATTELHEFCMELGILMQAQDDYLDAFCNETVTGKNGRDIQEGKCTWFSVTMLQRCNSAQLAIFKEYYGSNDLEDVKRIKQLYDELNLRDVYEQYEHKMYEDLLRRINEMPHAGGRTLLTGILNSCYKRVK